MRQEAFNTTLMGVLQPLIEHRFTVLDPGSDLASKWKAMPDAFRQAASFVLTGHAFLINIHEDLCPSGPYCWDDAWFNEGLQRLGIQRRTLPFFCGDTPAKSRVEAFLEVERHLTQGGYASILNMEHQSILGTGSDYFELAQPWGENCKGLTPMQLTFPAFPEFDEVHCQIYLYDFCEKETLSVCLTEALGATTRLWTDESSVAFPAYFVGRAAYTHWLDALEAHGDSHGCWWNAQVWAEGRQMLAAFFMGLPEYAEIFGLSESQTQACPEIAVLYREAADAFQAFSSKEREQTEMRTALEVALVAEEKAVALLEKMVANG